VDTGDTGGYTKRLRNTRYSGLQVDTGVYRGIHEKTEEYKIFRDTGGY